MAAVPIVVFSDFTCPFSYVTEAEVERVAEEEGEDGVRVRYAAFELYPAPAPLAPPGEPAGWPAALGPLAEAAGVELGVPPYRPRTRKAHEAARFAEEQALGPAMRRGIFAAYFGEGRDIGRVDVLVAIGEAIGLDRSALKVVLDVDRFTEAVGREGAQARAAGVQGTPTLVVGSGSGAQTLVGAQSRSDIRLAIREARTPPP